jgi:HEPN domain-containing protein
MEQADGELKAARDLYRTSNYAWCCFASQQAAEKALKAVLEHFGTPTGGHNLLVLISEIAGFIQTPADVERACRVLNRYYIITRYPNAFPSGAPIHMFGEEDAVEAMRHAEEVMEFARRVTGIA